ncbi:MAG: peptidoglycan-binding protein [Myxococcota bacterium]
MSLRDSKPVGSGDYLVQQGDCMHSIAVAHGHAWQTLWDHPANAELKEVRGDPAVLFPGDRVMIPPIRRKSVRVAIDQLHQFRREDVPFILRLRILQDGQPRADAPYRVEFPGETRRGALDGDGRLEEEVSPLWRSATLAIEDEAGDEDVYEVVIGGLNPADEVSGAQARLANLGYAPGKLDGKAGRKTQGAVRRFQRAAGLKEDGHLGDKTVAELRKLHGDDDD